MSPLAETIGFTRAAEVRAGWQGQSDDHTSAGFAGRECS